METNAFTIALRKLRAERNDVDNNSLPTREEICHILRGIQQRMPSRTSEEAYAQMERAREMSRRCRREEVSGEAWQRSEPSPVTSQNGMSSSDPTANPSLSTGVDRAGAL